MRLFPDAVERPWETLRIYLGWMLWFEGRLGLGLVALFLAATVATVAVPGAAIALPWLVQGTMPDRPILWVVADDPEVRTLVERIARDRPTVGYAEAPPVHGSHLVLEGGLPHPRATLTRAGGNARLYDRIARGVQAELRRASLATPEVQRRFLGGDAVLPDEPFLSTEPPPEPPSFGAQALQMLHGALDGLPYVGAVLVALGLVANLHLGSSAASAPFGTSPFLWGQPASIRFAAETLWNVIRMAWLMTFSSAGWLLILGAGAFVLAGVFGGPSDLLRVTAAFALLGAAAVGISLFAAALGGLLASPFAARSDEGVQATLTGLGAMGFSVGVGIASWVALAPLSGWAGRAAALLPLVGWVQILRLPSTVLGAAFTGAAVVAQAAWLFLLVRTVLHRQDAAWAQRAPGASA